MFTRTPLAKLLQILLLSTKQVWQPNNQHARYHVIMPRYFGTRTVALVPPSGGGKPRHVARAADHTLVASLILSSHELCFCVVLCCLYVPQHITTATTNIYDSSCNDLLVLRSND